MRLFVFNFIELIVNRAGSLEDVASANIVCKFIVCKLPYCETCETREVPEHKDD